MSIGNTCCMREISVVGIRVSIEDVLSYGIVEKYRLLLNKAEGMPERH